MQAAHATALYYFPGFFPDNLRLTPLSKDAAARATQIYGIPFLSDLAMAADIYRVRLNQGLEPAMATD